MAKLLALSFFPANLPPRSGGELRLFALYEALSRHHNVVLITSGELGAAPLTLRHNARFVEVRVPKGSEFAATWARLSPFAGGGDLSGPCLAAASAVPSAFHEAYLAHHAQADAIIHDSPFTVGYDLFLGFDSKPRIYNSYNVEFDLYRQIHADAKTETIAEEVRKWEEFLVRRAQLVTTCTSEDALRFNELYDLSGATAVIPNGVAPFATAVAKPTGNKLVFIGSGHYPNRTAATLIRDVLAKNLPDYEFHLIGRCMEPGRLAPNVISHGAVDEATKKQLLGSALACINPMLEGGGSSLKIPDLLAHGVPLISTGLGARGFGLAAGRHYSSIDPDDLIASARSALADRSRLAQQVRAAAKHICKGFTWPAIAHRLAKQIDGLISEQAKRPELPRLVALNDYDPFASVGGGNTRIKGLYEGASAHLRPMILTFSDSKVIVRREVFDGRGLVIAIPKAEAHCNADQAQAEEFHVSTVDLVAMSMAPQNPLLMALFRATESFTDLVACEHPYMASMLLGGQRKFIYSSQNWETGLKRQLLASHPRKDELLNSVAEIEKFCVGCSELLVAVSESDAAAFAAEHDLVAPVVVVGNGAEEPAALDEPASLLPGFNACFLGSGHMPNHLAAKFLIDELAPVHPEVTFHLAGSVCDGFETAPPNVRLLGRLSDEDKTRLLMSCQLAINPMTQGSGSNVKVADYLMHGLAVLSTPFGARGYEGLAEDDLRTASLSEFASIVTLLRSEYEAGDRSKERRDERRARFSDRFSMKAFGSQYGVAIRTILNAKRRALFVTYRYNEPPRGGGEQYVNRLVSYLADSGVAVDVLTAKVDGIEDKDRFGSIYPIEPGPYPVTFGHPLIRVAKFNATSVSGRTAKLDAIWAQQSAFEMQLFHQLPLDQATTGLTWGWAHPDDHGRWTLDQFGLQAGQAGNWTISGHSPGERYLVIRTSDGQPLLEQAVNGDFKFVCHAPAGLIEASVFGICNSSAADPRLLGLFVTELRFGSDSLLTDSSLNPLAAAGDPLAAFNALHEAASNTRFAAGVSLTDVRGPYAPDLETYLATHARDYDLVLAHNAVFRTSSQAVAAAKAAGVPSIMVPHAHFEDDYYHFPDVLETIANATRALVTPPTACRFLANRGLNNIEFLSPGIDGDEDFSEADESCFRARYGRTEPFVLVAGRKAAAKGYHHVIAAVAELRRGKFPDLRVVLTGPDDDGQPLDEDFVDYLGMVDRPVLRGAYRACEALANMSSSESFGIVLLEAGLASKPVLANADCAAFAELVEDGRNGYLAKSADLAERIARILSDQRLAKEMGKNGREMATQYDWGRIGATFVRHCFEVMAEKRT